MVRGWVDLVEPKLTFVNPSIKITAMINTVANIPSSEANDSRCNGKKIEGTSLRRSSNRWVSPISSGFGKLMRSHQETQDLILVGCELWGDRVHAIAKQDDEHNTNYPATMVKYVSRSHGRWVYAPT